MPGSPNTSFIPKHTPNKIERKNTPRQLFIGIIIVRVLFFAVLIASIGVFAFERKLASDLDKEVIAFKAATASFESDEEKLQEVISLDNRLAQANDRFSKSISLEAIFKALEKATVAAAQIRSLDIKKESDTELTVNAEIITDTFDSVIFQRTMFESSEVLAVTEFEDVKIEREGIDAEVTPGNLSISTGNSSVVFNAKVKINPGTIPAVMVSGQSPVIQTVVPVTASSSAATTSTSSVPEATNPNTP